MAQVDLNISIHDPDRFREAMAEAKNLGLVVQQSYADLGVACGSIDSAALPSLRSIKGLIFETDREVSVPRPVDRSEAD